MEQLGSWLNSMAKDMELTPQPCQNIQPTATDTIQSNGAERTGLSSGSEAAPPCSDEACLQEAHLPLCSSLQTIPEGATEDVEEARKAGAPVVLVDLQQPVEAVEKDASHTEADAPTPGSEERQPTTHEASGAPVAPPANATSPEQQRISQLRKQQQQRAAEKAVSALEDQVAVGPPSVSEEKSKAPAPTPAPTPVPAPNSSNSGGESKQKSKSGACSIM